MPKETVRIGCWAAFWGDTSAAAEQLMRSGPLDYLVSDYLSEITMALLARARAKDPGAGFVADAVSVLTPLLKEISERKIKVVTNAGALNPVACAETLSRAAKDAGLGLKVAAIHGDDVLEQRAQLGDARDMFTGAALPEKPLTMNAYLGAFPIAEALAQGADIVVTGRCVDSAVVLGPLIHEFGWTADDHDLLSAGSLIGHIVECGPQCLGGTFTDWQDVPGWEDMGYPIAECRADGTATITKPNGTGGLVSVGSVAEQILYEIGDPGAYLLPDVSCDWRAVELTQSGEHRVDVKGAKGTRPTPTYKVTATAATGWRAMTSGMFAGLDASGKARRVGAAVVKRAEQLGGKQFDEALVEVVGGGDVFGARTDTATEAVVKIGVRSTDRALLELFAREIAPLALVAQGMTGFFGGRPRVSPVIEVIHLLIDKATVPVSIVIDGASATVGVITDGIAPARTEPLAEQAFEPTADTVPLREIAWARSGDKGDMANIGVIARKPEYAAIIEQQVTAERVAAIFAPKGSITRWSMPGLNAVNILMDAALGGAGGTSTLRFDPQGKSYAAMLLSLPVEL